MEFCQTHLHQVRSAKAGLGAPCSARHRSSRITTTLVESTLTADLRAQSERFVGPDQLRNRQQQYLDVQPQ